MGVAVLACAWIFLKVGNLMNLPNVGLFTSLVYVGLGLVVVLIALAAAKIYLAPLNQQAGDAIFLTGIFALVSVAVVAPLINMFINGKYLGTLIAWTLGVATAVVAVALLSNIFRLIQDEERVFDRGLQHNKATQEMLK